MFRYSCVTLVSLVFALMMRVAWAQEVGTVATLEGTAEVGRGDIWTAADLGTAVAMGDQVRTGNPGRLSIVFQDDSVLTVADDSLVVIDQQVFNPSGGIVSSLIGLMRGKLQAVVGEYYHESGSAYEIKTVTAVAGVRGTEFSVSYDPATGVTEVMAVSGVVHVHSVVDPTGPGVLVRASEVTTVAPGQLPVPPHRIGANIFRQRLEGFQFVGGGRAESLVASNALRSGAAVAPPERAPASVGAQPPGQNPMERRDASNLVGDSPAIVKATTGQLGIAFPR
jgi:hypothetical protein